MISTTTPDNWKGVIYAYLYLFLLFISIVVMWALMLVGGNPFSIKTLGVYSSQQVKQTAFKPGEAAIVRGEFCSSASMGVELYPSLDDGKGFRYPLPNSLMAVETGCFNAAYGFIAPEIPPGRYTFRASIKFQNNLVGRDESAATPPLTIEILK